MSDNEKRVKTAPLMLSTIDECGLESDVQTVIQRIRQHVMDERVDPKATQSVTITLTFKRDTSLVQKKAELRLVEERILKLIETSTIDQLTIEQMTTLQDLKQKRFSLAKELSSLDNLDSLAISTKVDVKLSGLKSKQETVAVYEEGDDKLQMLTQLDLFETVRTVQEAEKSFQVAP